MSNMYKTKTRQDGLRTSPPGRGPRLRFQRKLFHGARVGIPGESKAQPHLRRRDRKLQGRAPGPPSPHPARSPRRPTPARVRNCSLPEADEQGGALRRENAHVPRARAQFRGLRTLTPQRPSRGLSKLATVAPRVAMIGSAVAPQIITEPGNPYRLVTL